MSASRIVTTPLDQQLACNAADRRRVNAFAPIEVFDEEHEPAVAHRSSISVPSCR
jgi:hypothetical protein